MDEPTNEPRPADSRPRLVAAHTNLTPTQEAWGAYTRHQLHCRQCADLDVGPCPTAGQLRQAWERVTREAFARLAGETS